MCAFIKAPYKKSAAVVAGVSGPRAWHAGLREEIGVLWSKTAVDAPVNVCCMAIEVLCRIWSEMS